MGSAPTVPLGVKTLFARTIRRAFPLGKDISQTLPIACVFVPTLRDN